PSGGPEGRLKPAATNFQRALRSFGGRKRHRPVIACSMTEHWRCLVRRRTTTVRASPRHIVHGPSWNAGCDSARGSGGKGVRGGPGPPPPPPPAPPPVPPPPYPPPRHAAAPQPPDRLGALRRASHRHP